jgi:hypothetical protein
MYDLQYSNLTHKLLQKKKACFVALKVPIICLNIILILDYLNESGRIN